jgi:hypothetical protein
MERELPDGDFRELARQLWPDGRRCMEALPDDAAFGDDFS